MNNELKKLEHNQIHEIQVELLRVFHSYCKKHGLQYALCGGTLLGAVRHKGFIPWDDDVDVIMPRRDFERLLNAEESWDKSLPQQLVSWRTGRIIYPFMKLIDSRTVIREKYVTENEYSSVWIDIFPLDGMPAEENKIRSVFRRIRVLKMLLMLAHSDATRGVTWYAKCVKRMITPLLKNLDTTTLCDKMNRIASQYNIDSSPYVGGFLWGYGPQERMPRSFLETIEIEFEGSLFWAPSCWDEYLRSLYGDYWRLPPEKDRIFHDYEAWIKG